METHKPSFHFIMQDKGFVEIFWSQSEVAREHSHGAQSMEGDLKPATKSLRS
jgi:hypothetical protein